MSEDPGLSRGEGEEEKELELPESHDDGHEGWIYTYADMITLLLALFIVLFINAKSKDDILPSVSVSFRGGPPGSPYLFSGGPSFFENFQTVLQSSELLEEVTITVDDRGIVAHLGESLLFRPGSAVISKEGGDVLDKFSKLVQVIPNSLVVEGYTDQNFRGNRFYPSAWELSAIRASRIVRELEARSVDTSRMEAVGYGPTRPRVISSNPEARRLNNRVEIVIRADDGTLP